MANTVKIEWLGHSCFKVTADGYAVVFDPYEKGSVAGVDLKNVTANEVIASHNHRDHNALSEVKIEKSEKPSPFQREVISSFHDNAGGAWRGANEINVLTFGDIKIVHFGDLGEQLLAKDLKACQNADAIMIPVGGYYTITGFEAAKIAKSLNARVVIPMHYRSKHFGFANLDTVQEFLKYMDDFIIYDVNSIEISKEVKKQTAVLRYTGYLE